MAEKAIVGNLLISMDAFADIAGELKEDDFHDFFLRRAYSAICHMKRIDTKAITDILTVSAFMRAMNGESDQEIFKQIAEVAASACSATNIKAYAEIVKKESNRRKTATLMNITQTKIANGDENYLEHLRSGLNNIENDMPFIVTPYADIMDNVIERLDKDCDSGGKITGLATGFIDLDDYTNGLQDGDLIILAARPSVGKTMFMLNIADNIGCFEQNEPVVLFSLEMPQSQLVKRSLARASKVKGDLIFKAKVNNSDWKLIGEGLKKLRKSKVFINDNSRMSVYQMRSFCRKIRNEHGLKAVFIDYIGLVDGEGENETLRLANISRDLKALAKDFNVPVFVLCQLNRNIEKRVDRTPMLSDIRQCGNIEQDADLIMFLDRDKDQDNVAKLLIAKHRNGKTGEIGLVLDLNYFEFKTRTKWQ